jgi:hypothetical protein
MEDISLQIHKTSQPNKSSLTLEGTVLIFEEKDKLVESEMQIPVELITIYEGKKLRGSRLIIGLLFPAVSLLVSIILGFFIFDFLGVSKDSTFFNVFLVCFFSVFLLSIIICGIYVVRFFIRAKTISFVISPDEYIIEFWKNKKDFQKIDVLLEQIQQRQVIVETPFEYPAANSIYTSKYSPIRRIILIIFLFAIPALITEIPYLFFLVLLPVIWFAYNGILYLKHPKEYRQAMSLYIQKNWNEAIKLLEGLKEKSPRYLPAYYLLIGIYLHIKQFDNALNVAASLPYEYQDLSQDIQINIWYFKRLHERRKIQMNSDL